ncbi:hypothetical protein ACGF5C_29625 [Micromonospora sp. NPDC047620]|uniref:hypothetical protein n=1 Tax=Micromonospora sp. NPDC047620 TaxID=3364251 RepID=UPI003715EE79
MSVLALSAWPPSSMSLGEIARRKSEAPLPRRWSHVQAIAAKARAVSDAVAGERDVLVASAWLHDVGYSPGLVDTGLWAGWREAAGWPKEGTFHSLRHFFATTL